MREIIVAGALLGLTLPAGARQIQAVGTTTTFDVATWNVEWFGSTSNGPSNEETQQRNAADIIEQAGIDLWALQEIASTTAFQNLLETLGTPWAGELATSSGDGTQRVGFIYRTDVVTKRNSRLILEQFSSDFAGRPPLRLEVNVMLPDTVFTAVVVTTHMKAFDDLQSYDKRLAASSRLEGHFDFLESTANLVWLGDLNDKLLTSITSGKASPYENFRAKPERYRFLTLPLEEAGECTFCGGSTPSTIDHILVSDELFDAAEAGMTDRLDAVYSGFPGFLSNTSDHYPVYARLRPVSGSVAVEELPSPGRFDLYPLPAGDRVTLTLDRPTGGNVRVRILDLLGRERNVVELEPGSAGIVLDTSSLPPGLYIVSTSRGSRILPVVR